MSTDPKPTPGAMRAAEQIESAADHQDPYSIVGVATIIDREAVQPAVAEVRERYAKMRGEYAELLNAAGIACRELRALRECDGWTNDTDGATEWVGPRVHAAEDVLRETLAAVREEESK